MNSHNAFAKNWLFRLSATQPVGSGKTPLSTLKKGLAWCGGLLVWLILILPAQAAVEMRVAVSQGNNAISVGTSTQGIIKNGSGQALYQLPGLQGITIEADATGVDLTNGGNTLAESNAFWLEPSEDGFVWIGDKWYRGRVMVTLEGGKLTAINYVDLEDYLYSVVGSEMPVSWPQAALQSQAVAARSYALYKQARTRNPLYDVDATTTYQVYKGLLQEAPSTISAVDATKNQVVTYNGQVIEALFHSSSGGFTENASDVWSSDVPYLRGVEDYDQTSPVFRWKETFSVNEFSSKIGSVGQVSSIGSPTLTKLGRVASITIAGDRGSKVLKGSDVRSALGLRSTRFTIALDKNAGKVTVTGSGFGHGVGMSQWGARTLADQGWSFDQILQHYYQSTAIAQLEN
ncbi:MAG: sporulation protein [Leptolyngbya foveolarum]|uniref:Sporulation protein n=1 Tax=Leptolyngbya foveolarum TaxID=47253 RepID=A0A2W4WA50_9CYAN|nr:MAG: sporulation protein [Leptolyngbya foveolarum]